VDPRLIGNLFQSNYSAAKMGVIGLSNSIALDMANFGVTSNCVAPFAWTRLAATISEEKEPERYKRFKSMGPEKIAPLVAGLCTDEAKYVTGQVFCVRKNEIFLFDRPMPVRAMQRSEGWTVGSIVGELLPAFRPSFTPRLTSADVFGWDPI